MDNIKQTWFGKFLCWLGVHQVVCGQAVPVPRAGYLPSLYGGCIRCNKGFGWDV